MTELVMCLTRQCVYTKQTTMEGSAFGFQTIPAWEPHSAHGAEWGSQLTGKLVPMHMLRCRGQGLGCCLEYLLLTALIVSTPRILSPFLGSSVSFSLSEKKLLNTYFILFCDFDKNLT